MASSHDAALTRTSHVGVMEDRKRDHTYTQNVVRSGAGDGERKDRKKDHTYSKVGASGVHMDGHSQIQLWTASCSSLLYVYGENVSAAQTCRPRKKIARSWVLVTTTRCRRPGENRVTNLQRCWIELAVSQA